MCGVTRTDKPRDEHILGTTRVAQASKTITDGRVNRYGHAARRDEEHTPMKVLRTDVHVPGKWKRE